MVGEVSFSIIFEPPGFLISVSAGGSVEIAIGIHIQDDQRMGLFERGVNWMLAPGRPLEPHHAVPVAAAGDEIRFPVAVDVAGLNISGSDLFFGDDVFLPGFRRILRRFPPGKEIPQWRWISLGARRRVLSSVSINIPESEVMSKSRGILVRKHMCHPVLR